MSGWELRRLRPSDPRRRAYRVLWFGQFAAVAGLTVVVPLLPFYLAGLGLAASEIALWTGLSLAAPAVTQLITGPLWGRVGDRYGHKAMVVRAHAGLAVAVGLMALVQTPEAFLACRLLQGACGGVVSATATYASSLSASARQGRALGGLFSATAAGSLLGPLLGGVLAGQFGYGALFGCVAALLVVSSALALLVLPRTNHAVHDRPAGSVLSVASTLLHSDASRWLLLGGLLGQAAIFALVVVFAGQVERITASLAAATMWVGALQALTWTGSLAGGPWWGRRNDRHRPNRSFTVAAVCCGVAVALQALPASPEMLVPLRIAQGFCFAAFLQSVLHATCRVAGQRVRGTAIGVTTGILDLGQLAGPLLGAVAVTVLPASWVFASIGALLCGAAAASAYGARCQDRPRLAAPTVPQPVFEVSR